MSDEFKKDSPEPGAAKEAEGAAVKPDGTGSATPSAELSGGPGSGADRPSADAQTGEAKPGAAGAAPLDAEAAAKAKADAEAREARAIARALRKGTPLPTASAGVGSADAGGAAVSDAVAPAAGAPGGAVSGEGAPSVAAASGEATPGAAGAAPLEAEAAAKAKADAEAREARAIARALRKGTPLPTAGSGADAPSGAAVPGAAAPAAGSAPLDAEAEAKAKAAAEARAARASARGKKPEGEDDGAPKVPSPMQPRLDHLVKLIKEQIGETAIEEAFINERDAHLPYIVVKNEHWARVALLLKQHCELKLNYLRNVSGIDQETHMEVAYHLLAIDTKYEVCVKVKTSRETPSIASVALIWPTANWNEREIYDLLGIDFPGHPDLRRIMMSDDWVGHPLRKDYEALDPEV
ncbi:NADH-quinone oxidoreductase subunit C [Paenibacillus agricola]|uniref:NADH-quinone oxidoreductase n=1 Tax=Paenibacillus agricola TaxID=2716264 RepID=A0ABX0JJ47_9BACL|nr:NADH-quinone oxidoreductase subunit C [Paenibacillus agricola]NHN33825.1 protein NuoC [Paenibacillus agricola]